MSKLIYYQESSPARKILSGSLNCILLKMVMIVIYFSFNKLKSTAETNFIKKRLEPETQSSQFLALRINDVWGHNFGHMSKEFIVKYMLELRRFQGRTW